MKSENNKMVNSEIVEKITEEKRSAGGLRRSVLIKLTESEIEYLKGEIKAIEADESVFLFNEENYTGYSDEFDEIDICGSIFPDKNSLHPRDLMSERAVLAHEYYGHRAFKDTSLIKGAWNDEFRASYTAAKNAPNLSDEDRRYLILDALERAKEAGVVIKNNNFMRRILYGY